VIFDFRFGFWTSGATISGCESVETIIRLLSANLKSKIASREAHIKP
jgi:hypothetical protein